MPGFLVTVGGVVNCTHMGKGNMIPNPRVKLSGQPIPMFAPPVTIAGCPFMMPVPPPVPSPHPCIAGNWLPPSGTLRVKSMGQPLVCASTQGMIMATTPPAPPNPLKVTMPGQTRVQGQ